MGVTFDEQGSSGSQRLPSNAKQPFFTTLLLKMGVIKRPSQANFVLGLISATCIALTLLLIFWK